MGDSRAEFIVPDSTWKFLPDVLMAGSMLSVWVSRRRGLRVVGHIADSWMRGPGEPVVAVLDACTVLDGNGPAWKLPAPGRLVLTLRENAVEVGMAQEDGAYVYGRVVPDHVCGVCAGAGGLGVCPSCRPLLRPPVGRDGDVTVPQVGSSGEWRLVRGGVTLARVEGVIERVGKSGAVGVPSARGGLECGVAVTKVRPLVPPPLGWSEFTGRRWFHWYPHGGGRLVDPAFRCRNPRCPHGKVVTTTYCSGCGVRGRAWGEPDRSGTLAFGSEGEVHARCGMPLNPEDRFCPGCGGVVGGTRAEARRPRLML